jgi:DHA1 family bicyclomycin/chloramphenicol resistance-like MFS transporter
MAARREFARLALLTLLVASAALSVDIAIPVLSAFAAAFRVSSAAAQLTLSVFVLGFGVAQLVAGPLSDRFGRRPVLIGGCALYVVASIACIFAEGIGELIAARFVQALGCSVGPVVARAIVRDVYGGERAAKVLAYMATVMGFVPGIAPILGGFLAEEFGWRAIFVALLGFGVTALLGCLLVLDETNRWQDREALRPRRLAANYVAILGDRRFLSYVCAGGFTYAALLSFHSLSPFVIIDQMGVRTANYGYWFLGIVLGFMSGTFTSGRLHGRFGADTLVATGLAVAVAAALLMAILGWARVDAPVAVVGPMALLLYGAGFVFPNATAGAIAPHQTKAGAASALLGFVQFATGALVAALLTRFHDGTQFALVTGVLACTLLALASFLLLSPRPRTVAAPAE